MFSIQGLLVRTSNNETFIDIYMKKIDNVEKSLPQNFNLNPNFKIQFLFFENLTIFKNFIIFLQIIHPNIHWLLLEMQKHIEMIKCVSICEHLYGL